MRLNQALSGFAVFMTLMSNALAHDVATLKEERLRVLQQYVNDLQRTDYKDISQLFEKDGTVTTNSHGNMNAKEFFYSFLPKIASAHTQLNQTFTGEMDGDHFAARFHFTYKMKDGEEGRGEYVDEFVFTNNSVKLAAVYMFENLVF